MSLEYKSVFVPCERLKPKMGYKSYDHELDGVEFNHVLQAIINDHVEEGYEVENVTPLTSTMYYGRTYTEGLIVLFKRNVAIES